MVNIEGLYEGGLHCKLKHGPSGAEIVTDAPKDNHGKGAAFSPTDLVAAALGACMMTIMGIVAERHGLNLEGTKIYTTKEMVQEPVRRIGRLTVRFDFPAGIPVKERPVLERAALTCPVHQSLHENVKIDTQFVFPD